MSDQPAEPCADQDSGLAEIWEAIADTQPHALAIACGDGEVSWEEFEQKSEGLARCLVQHGIRPQSSFAQLLANGRAYLEAIFAAIKVRLTPVNTNFRYGATEILQVWGDADVQAVIFDHALLGVVEVIRPACPAIALWICVADDDSAIPDWCVDYRAIPTQRRAASATGGSNDLVLVYTGGTTGRPKGVEWHQGALLGLLCERQGLAPPPRLARTTSTMLDYLDKLRPRVVLACPLMHAAGLARAMGALLGGGVVVMLPPGPTAPRSILEAIDRWKADRLAIVGDAIAVPLVDLLDDARAEFDLSSLRLITSGGSRLSEQVARALLEHLPGIVIEDVIGASEAIGIATATWAPDDRSTDGRFVLSDDSRLLQPDSTAWVEPMAGVRGILAKRGHVARGYRGRTRPGTGVFQSIGGEPWVVTGDVVEFVDNRSVKLLGRGSTSINSGGEKVYPEEVESVILQLDAVADVAVVGVPDAIYGEAVTAVVVLAEGQRLTIDDLRRFVKARLASYKAPRLMLIVDDLERPPTGKLDHSRWSRKAAELVGGSPPIGDEATSVGP